MGSIESIPDKEFFKVSEVCQLTNTQPYVLRFWESEFPQLSPDKSRGGQSVYRREDVSLVMRIKQLLYDEEVSLADARTRLESELADGVETAAVRSTKPKPKAKASGSNGGARQKPERAAAPRETTAPGKSGDRASGSTVDRARYDDALDEIAELRLQVQEAESRAKRAEVGRQEADHLAAQRGERLERAASQVQTLLSRLEPDASA